jgi:hypothetical protein
MALYIPFPAQVQAIFVRGDRPEKHLGNQPTPCGTVYQGVPFGVPREDRECRRNILLTGPAV